MRLMPAPIGQSWTEWRTAEEQYMGAALCIAVCCTERQETGQCASEPCPHGKPCSHGEAVAAEAPGVQNFGLGCTQGDRVGVCLAGLDAACMERGLACAPGSVPTFRAAVAAVEKIRFHAGALPSRGRVHVTVGHMTQVRVRTEPATPLA